VGVVSESPSALRLSFKEEVAMSPGESAPSLGPGEELELIRRWQDCRDQEAASRLMEAHRVWVRGLVRRFSSSALPDEDFEDLMQEAWLGFFEAVGKYDLSRAKPLKSYAWPWVRRRLIEALVAKLGLSDDARRVWKLVLDVWEQLAQEQGGKSTREEIEERVLSRLREGGGKRMSEARARKAIKEVLDALERTIVPLWDEPEEEEEGVSVGVSISTQGPDPEKRAINRALLREWCQKVCGVLGREQGQKWVVAFILRKQEGAEYWELVDWLRTSNSPAHGFWPDVCEKCGLNGCVPASWPEVQHLFAVPPPTLSEESLRQWYGRGRNQLLDAGLIGIK
jgi:RNA polymerase sigma factor (sigma-70 family)